MTHLYRIKNIFQGFRELYLTRDMLVIAILGYGSGIPFTLIFGTYLLRLTEEGINYANIGLFGLVGLPFTVKFLWSPLVDGVKLPLLKYLGQRRSWLILSQIILSFLIAIFVIFPPKDNLMLLSWLAFSISFVSATYDIAYDALRVELLKDEEQGAGAAISITGYRIGMLVSGGVSLILADILGWELSFFIISASLFATILATLLSREPLIHRDESYKNEALPHRVSRFVSNYVIKPFSKFLESYPNWLFIIIFAIMYKIGDALLGKMVMPFYFEMGFSKTEIAEITKIFGFFMTILGGFIGGYAVYRIGLIKSLLIFGILQAISNFSYVWQAIEGYNLAVLTIVIALENITGAMGTAAFVAYLSSLCNKQFTATQYALLSSVSSLGRYLTNAPSGYMVDDNIGWGLSWEWYFTISVIISIPGIIMILFLRHKK